jgi:CHAD domain-containing protein
VRNYDVFLILIEKEIISRRGAHREQYELLKAYLNMHRSAQAEKVIRKLANIKVETIAHRLGIDLPTLEGQADETAGGDVSAKEPAKDGAALEARAVLMNGRRISIRAAQRLEQRVVEFHEYAAMVHPTTHPEELHQLRIAAKRVRYLLEILTELGVGHPARALAWLRSLQDRIGDWHDLVALEEEIIAIVSQPGFMKEHLAESSRMLGAASQLQKKKEALVSRLFPLKVPKHLETSSQGLVRTLRRRAAREPAPVQTA